MHLNKYELGRQSIYRAKSITVTQPMRQKGKKWSAGSQSSLQQQVPLTVALG